ncbi:MAG: PASTA domain-containing protein, partial [Eggerthellaceae bacterium]|nr:PASTA domain-containing protein [Eggerthellaceae bacterium]
QSSSSQVSVPDVAGKTVEEATALLEQAGLKVASTQEATDDTYPAGQVVRTDPAVGADIAPGTAVTLYVSSGKEQVSVPDLSGNDGDGAKQLIEAAGLKAHEGASEHSDSVEEGKVIRQDPEAGAMVDAGSTVTYILSKGSDKVEVPDVMGKSEAEATTTLRNQGFNVDVYHGNSRDVPAGNVMTINPEPGTKLNKGDTVSITISDGAVMHYVSAEIYSEPQTALANVALDAYEVADGGSVGYYITVPDGYTIVNVTDGATNYGTAASGTITDVTHDLVLVVSLVGTTPASSSSSTQQPTYDTTGTDTGTIDTGTGTDATAYQDATAAAGTTGI